jgi:hypothetical protein
VVLVVALKHVLVGQEPEERDRLVEHDVNLLLRLALEALLEVVVDEEGDVLGGLGVGVDEELERLATQNIRSAGALAGEGERDGKKPR